METEKIAEWLSKHPQARERIAKVYRRWGADAARGLLVKIVAGALGEAAACAVRGLRRAELRDLLGIEADRVGYARAIEAHRLAWDVAGWNARAWYVSPGGDGGYKRGKGGGKSSIARARARDGLQGGSK